jgi:hypothetical protein
MQHFWRSLLRSEIFITRAAEVARNDQLFATNGERHAPSGSRRFQAMKTIKRLTMAAIARQRDAIRCLRQAQGKSNNGVTLQHLRRGPTRLKIRKKTKGVSHE